MAHLGTKTSDGQLSFDKYVANNPKWASNMKFVIENGVVDAPIVEIKENLAIETGFNVSQGTPIHIMSKSYKTIKKSRFVKIRLAGGKGISGYMNLAYIRKPSSENVMKSEERAIRDLDDMIRNIQVPVTIIVEKTGGGGIFEVKDITEARKIGGTPKADLALFNRYGNPVFWISHKKEGDASAFQQYSGVSAQSGATIYQHKESKQFMRDVIEFIEEEKLSQPVFRRINDPKLKRLSIYGPDIMMGNKYSQNNVQLIGQGKPILTPINDDATFRLTFSSHSSTNEDSHGLGGDYEPVFIATYRAGRGFSVDNQSYKGARLGIAPFAMIKNRRDILEI